MNVSPATVKENKPEIDFTAIDSEGRPFTLSEYKGKKHVVLVFNRGFT
jgi:peroxiredoxin